MDVYRDKEMTRSHTKNISHVIMCVSRDRLARWLSTAIIPYCTKIAIRGRWSGILSTHIPTHYRCAGFCSPQSKIRHNIIGSKIGCFISRRKEPETLRGADMRPTTGCKKNLLRVLPASIYTLSSSWRTDRGQHPVWDSNTRGCGPCCYDTKA